MPAKKKRGGGKTQRRKVKGHRENKGERQANRSWGRKRQKVRGGKKAAAGEKRVNEWKNDSRDEIVGEDRLQDREQERGKQRDMALPLSSQINRGYINPSH